MRSTVVTSVPAAVSDGHSKLSCILLGHQAADRCDCRREPFAENGAVRHIRHVLSCFLGGHQFVKLGSRLSHNEYLCHACGHQLLLRSDRDPCREDVSFWRRPQYFCSVFGHRVQPIGKRYGLVEYVCGCGHSFMNRRVALKKIKHPVTCTLFGHFVRFLGRRDGCSEYLCKVCGHTFCYATATY